jgi:hypothetical protein
MNYYFFIRKHSKQNQSINQSINGLFIYFNYLFIYFYNCGKVST